MSEELKRAAPFDCYCHICGRKQEVRLLFELSLKEQAEYREGYTCTPCDLDFEGRRSRMGERFKG